MRAMSTVTFDTLKFAKRLEAAGASAQLAEAMAEAQQEAFSEALQGQLATKTDISEVKASVAEVRAELVLIRWILGTVLVVALANFAKQFF